MTPKEKAIELIGKMCLNNCTETNINRMINPCLIAVDELINAFKELSIMESGGVNIDFGHTYWEEVKKEIKKL